MSGGRMSGHHGPQRLITESPRKMRKVVEFYPVQINDVINIANYFL